MKLCPCGSHLEYQKCCGPYHQGALATSALALMRSRYSAYALKLADYIMDTTHPKNPGFETDRVDWKHHILEFCEKTDFLKLEILDFEEESDHVATVSFVAYLDQKGKDVTFTEKSHFEKIKDKWLYKEGRLLEGARKNEDL